MPLNSRPLFLVPSLMRELPHVGAVMVDVTDLEAEEITATSATSAANALLDQLEPLIVEANLAGYEITVIAATTGTATTPCLVLNVDAFLVDSINEPWNTVVSGVNVTFGANVKAALALRFEPRLALRKAVDDGGSVIASSYGIAFATPSGWLGTVDSNNGGWLVTTTSTPTTLPAGLTAIAGRPGNPGAPATALLQAIRTAATAQWQVHGRGPGQLTHCALAPLFDPSTWRVPAGDEGASVASGVLTDHLWESTGWVPAYGELAGWTLTEVLNRGGGLAGAVRGLDVIRSELRQELIRRELVDPKTIDGVSRREGELGPRFDEIFASVETVGQPLFAVDLFRMLELGLMSLDRRVADEEMLPALVEREWTEPVLTGFYDSVTEIATIPIGVLANDDSARDQFTAVATAAVVLSINQAGDHVEGFWHGRLYDKESDHPVTVAEWFAAGERDHSRPGIVYDILWLSGQESMTGTYSFAEVDGGLEVVADWGASATIDAGTMTFRRRDLPQPVFEPGEDEAVEPPSPMVRAYQSTGEIDALPTEIRESIRVEERYSLHPAEIVLLDAIVGRVAKDLEELAENWGPGTTTERMALCTNLESAFGYFVRGEDLSEHASTARQYVVAALQSMPGNNTPIDEWDRYAPKTYYHALAKAHQEFHCPNNAVTTCLGVSQQQLAWFAADNEYRYRFHISLSSAKTLKDFTLGEVTEQLVKKLATKGVLIGTKVKKVLSIGPTPQYDIIEAEFQKKSPLPDEDWEGSRGDPDDSESEWYDGYLLGGAIAATAGMSVSSATEWNEVNTLGDRWSPDDFAGYLVTAGLFWGMSVFGLEGAVEAPVNWVLDKLGHEGTVRVSGDVSYTKFTAPPKADAWSISRGFTNSAGLHAELGGGVTGGSLRRRGQQPDPSAPEPGVREPLRIAGISFEVGRSELTPAGHTLLRQAAADRLHELADPSTALEVIGHASFGDARPLYNLTLSQRRAANVLRTLKAYLGPLYAVPPERTTVVGVGDQESGEDEDAPPEQWRRVDVLINGEHAVELRTGAP